MMMRERGEQGKGGNFKINSNFSDCVGESTLLGLARVMFTGMQAVPQDFNFRCLDIFFFSGVGLLGHQINSCFKEFMFCTVVSLFYILFNNRMIVGMGWEGRGGKF